MKERVLDLVFLVGVLFKGLDGLVELIGGVVLLFVTPAKLVGAIGALTAKELSEDPHDLIANLLIHGVAHVGSSGLAFVAAYLLLHGAVKIAIVIALLIGSRRIYPWAMAALGAFLVFQIYELITKPSIGVAVLTVFDAVIIWLTWREWRRGRELRDTWRGTIAWVFHRDAPAVPGES
ncbi:DUF2127 domain-containing protein [Microbacterium sp. ASV49]|uniref:DUF2127 domain-containing protein n=1 Tax=Microbacterium candidum TaxID=3041922 RepID=A0ABT7N271_9MICO|nr:DUF2127 domain-containing protein [Microbacterium sp. ASV49]MDL9980810.1 DUF2127 domain-containing protein [Microbacterium sp. ASV49]